MSYPAWDKTQSYKKYAIVNYQDALFAAVANVPADTPIDDTSKWLMIYKNQAFTNHERFQMLMIEKAGEGGKYKDISADHDNWTINANSRASVTIPMLDDASDEEIIAYRVINLQLATHGGVNRDGCVLQFFQTADHRKSAQVAVRNVTSENAKIKVTVECLVGTVI